MQKMADTDGGEQSVRSGIRGTGLAAAIADAVEAVQPAAAVVMLNGSPRLALTIDETAALLGVNRRNVREWIDSGDLTALPLAAPGNANRHYRISVASVIALVNRADVGV